MLTCSRKMLLQSVGNGGFTGTIETGKPDKTGALCFTPHGFTERHAPRERSPGTTPQLGMK